MRPLLSIAALSVLLPLSAAAATPEIQRPAVTPQKIGAVHTLRTIPEACARIEGEFSADTAKPYAMKLVPLSANCQARAQMLDAAKVKPESNPKWVLNDVIKVPNAACPSQVAELSVWRLRVSNAPYKLDAQGRARVYLQKDAQQAYTSKDAKRETPAYAVALNVTGTCK